MPIQIARITYFFLADIHQECGVARQTLWRWRKARKIPQGHIYRDRQVLFTRDEVDAIRDYANRLALAGPAETQTRDCLSDEKDLAKLEAPI